MTVNRSSKRTNADYSNQAAVPNYADYFAAWRTRSAEARQALPCYLDVPYGPGWRQTCDIFHQGQDARAPVFVFIHGGWWHFLDKSDFSYLAPAFVGAGCVQVNVAYPLAPMASLETIVESVQLSLVWIWKNIERFGGDPHRIVIGGHSAGGHLTAMSMAADWTRFEVPQNVIKAGCAVSGLFDLVKLLDTPHNESIRMLPQTAASMSPIRSIPSSAGPLLIAVGGEETRGFLDQHHAFTEAWLGSGLPGRDLIVEGRNHFSVIDDLGDPESVLFASTMELLVGAKQSPRDSDIL